MGSCPDPSTACRKRRDTPVARKLGASGMTKRGSVGNDLTSEGVSYRPGDFFVGARLGIRERKCW